MAGEPLGKCGMCTNILIQLKCMMKHVSFTREPIALGNTKDLALIYHFFYHLPTAPRHILILMCLPHGLPCLKNHLGFQLQRINYKRLPIKWSIQEKLS